MAKPEESKETVKAHRLHIWQIQAVRDLLFVAAIFGIFWAGYALRAVSIPLLVALLLAYLFEPLVDRLCKHPKINRPRAVGGILATCGFSVLLVLALALPLIIGQTVKFVDEVRNGEFRADVARLGKYVPEAFSEEFNSVLKLLPGDAQPVVDEPEINLPNDNSQAANTITNQQLSDMKDEIKSEEVLFIGDEYINKLQIQRMLPDKLVSFMKGNKKSFTRGLKNYDKLNSLKFGIKNLEIINWLPVNKKQADIMELSIVF